MGFDRVPTTVVKGLSEEQTRAFVIADNRLAEDGRWDEVALQSEIKAILDLDVDFDLTLTGFESPEIDRVLEFNLYGTPPQETVEEPDPNKPQVTQLGDLWLLGRHRVLCGDVLDGGAAATLMGDDLARCVVTDPPYNVPIDGHVSGLGKIRHREFAMARGEMSSEEFQAFLKTVLTNLINHSRDGALHFVFMDWRHAYDLLSAARSIYSETKNLCIWNKDNGGMGSLYRSKHELVFLFKVGTVPHVNNVELGKHGRNRTNVWDYPGVNTLRPGRMEELSMHPTVKPVTMIADAVLDTTHRGDIVLDGFGGSGTTLIAAERTGRAARLMELDPRYVDVTIRRWQSETGESAVLADTGEPFSDIAERRISKTPRRRRKTKGGK